MLRLACALFGIALGLCATCAHAQLHRASDPVATPASSLVLMDDALALDVNPAALALLPAWSAALLHSEMNERGSWLGRGDALYAGGRVIGPLAIAATVQSVRPDDLAAGPRFDSDADRAMFALALAFATSESLSFGLTTRTFSSSHPSFDGLTALDVGALLRPSSWLSVSLVARDLFVSREGFGTADLDLGSSLLLSAGLRPFGDALTLDLGLAVDTSDAERLGARAGAVLQLPYVGTASSVLEVDRFGDDDANLRLLLELAVNYGMFGAVGGAALGDSFDDGPGWYAMLRADGEPRPGIPLPAEVLELELSGIGPRGMTAVALALERARTDDRIAGVLLKPRGSGIGLAYAQELRLQIAALRARGKPVVCHLDSASGAEYYACAGATRVLLDPAGDIRLLGSATSVLLFGETLRKLGIRADFVRIGPYKSAPESYTQTQMSEAAREQTRSLLDDAHARVLTDLASDLQVPPSRVAAIMDEGPQLARAARKAKLIAATADEYDLDSELGPGLSGRPRTGNLPRIEPRSWGTEPRVGVVMLDEEIVDGDNVDIPLVEIHMTGGNSIVQTIDGMASDPDVRSIVLRIDSPGGAALASEKIWRAVRRARKRKPVIASMGAIAASGGYYVAAGASEIWADPSTVTGSIGIFYGKVDVAELADKLGVHIEHFRRGKRAGGESLFRPFTDDERAALADILRDYYRLFISRVAEGRGMSVEAVDALARGRVYSGDAALRVGLVDRLGGLGSALVRARELGGLDADSEVEVRPTRPSGLLDYVLGGTSVSAAVSDSGAPVVERPAGLQLPREARPLVRMLLAIDQLATGQPLALMPFAFDL